MNAAAATVTENTLPFTLVAPAPALSAPGAAVFSDQIAQALAPGMNPYGITAGVVPTLSVPATPTAPVVPTEAGTEWVNSGTDELMLAGTGSPSGNMSLLTFAPDSPVIEEGTPMPAWPTKDYRPTQPIKIAPESPGPEHMVECHEPAAERQVAAQPVVDTPPMAHKPEFTPASEPRVSQGNELLPSSSASPTLSLATPAAPTQLQRQTNLEPVATNQPVTEPNTIEVGDFIISPPSALVDAHATPETRSRPVQSQTPVPQPPATSNNSRLVSTTVPAAPVPRQTPPPDQVVAEMVAPTRPACVEAVQRTTINGHLTEEPQSGSPKIGGPSQAEDHKIASEFLAEDETAPPAKKAEVRSDQVMTTPPVPLTASVSQPPTPLEATSAPSAPKPPLRPTALGPRQLHRPDQRQPDDLVVLASANPAVPPLPVEDTEESADEPLNLPVEERRAEIPMPPPLAHLAVLPLPPPLPTPNAAPATIPATGGPASLGPLRAQPANRPAFDEPIRPTTTGLNRASGEATDQGPVPSRPPGLVPESLTPNAATVSESNRPAQRLNAPKAATAGPKQDDAPIRHHAEDATTPPRTRLEPAREVSSGIPLEGFELVDHTPAIVPFPTPSALSEESGPAAANVATAAPAIVPQTPGHAFTGTITPATRQNEESSAARPHESLQDALTAAPKGLPLAAIVASPIAQPIESPAGETLLTAAASQPALPSPGSGRDLSSTSAKRITAPAPATATAPPALPTAPPTAPTSPDQPNSHDRTEAVAGQAEVVLEAKPARRAASALPATVRLIRRSSEIQIDAKSLSAWHPAAVPEKLVTAAPLNPIERIDRPEPLLPANEPVSPPAPAPVVNGGPTPVAPKNEPRERKTTEATTPTANFTPETKDPAIPAASKREATEIPDFRPKTASFEAGTPVAHTVPAMTKMEKRDEIAGRKEQSLPVTGASAIGAAPESLSASLPHSQTASAPTDLESTTPANASADVLATTFSTSPRSQELPAHQTTTTGDAARRVEQVITEIGRHTVQFRHFNAESMAVVLKPDAQTEILLQLVQRDGIIEVNARFERGDFQALNGQWEQLQQSLASQGVRVGSLHDASNAGFFNSGGSQNGFTFHDGNSRQQEERQRPAFFREEFAFAGGLAESPRPQSRRATAGNRRLETWA